MDSGIHMMMMDMEDIIVGGGDSDCLFLDLLRVLWGPLNDRRILCRRLARGGVQGVPEGNGVNEVVNHFHNLIFRASFVLYSSRIKRVP
jgi:hypothetical protein